MYFREKKNCRLSYVLAKFLFTTSETELDYYHKKVNVRVTSRVAERLKTQDFRKFENFKKIPEMLRFDGKYPANTQKANFDICTKKCEKSAKNHFIEKHIFLNVVDLSTILCPRLCDGAFL